MLSEETATGQFPVEAVQMMARIAEVAEEGFPFDQFMKKEFGDAEGAKAPSDEEMKKFTEKCVADLDKEKEKIGAAKYKEQVKCVMAADKMEALMKCEKEEEEKGRGRPPSFRSTVPPRQARPLRLGTVPFGDQVPLSLTARWSNAARSAGVVADVHKLSPPSSVTQKPVVEPGETIAALIDVSAWR
jgi:hypothetical protein